jgi:signal transduction histidine kinase
VLEPFVRGDDARNMDEAAGFGLGLSITNAIVTAHGGQLSLRPAAAWTGGSICLPVRQRSDRSTA